MRGSFDFRQHFDLGNESWLVFRQFVGLGLPYGNSKDLPFERSFYGGGSNGLRGWLYRSVGPGGYVPTNEFIEKTGDLQLELNAEYRFPLYNIINGAVFVDAGNVWAYYPNEFLIIRLDFAYAMRNPYPDEIGNYWRFNQFGNLKMQLGIGYPF